MQPIVRQIISNVVAKRNNFKRGTGGGVEGVDDDGMIVSLLALTTRSSVCLLAIFLLKQNMLERPQKNRT